MAGRVPWPEVCVGNQNHADVAVVIIGGGISGMCVAIDLLTRNRCRNFVILEKSAGLGGTWYDNRYPGCCCDVWSQLYSYSFAQNPRWTREYPGQEEILQYLLGVAQQFKLLPHCRFNSTVQGARWDDEVKKWRVHVQTCPGSTEAEYHAAYEMTADFVVSAVGQLNVPRWPAIEGLDGFEGKKMHSARWDWSYDLRDKKIALIGNGCTAAQILPEMAQVAQHVTVFQRTPNWVVPRDDGPVSPLWRWIYTYVPGAMARKRARLMDFREWTHSFVRHPHGPVNHAFKHMSEQMMRRQLPNRPDLWAKLTPTYHVGCKRVIVSDDYFPAIGQSNVVLETRPIAGIHGRAVQVVDSSSAREQVVDAENDFDLVVCATGFQTVDFMHPIQLAGRDGRSLAEVWKDGAQALYGITVEDMPNFGMLYGPNTNLGHNSIILMIEAQSRYINGLVKPVLDARANGTALAFRPKKELLVAYNRQIQAELRSSAFHDPQCNSWYKNEAGRITHNWSRTVVAYQQMVETVNYEDFDVDGAHDIVDQTQPLRVGRVKEESTVSDGTLILGAVASTAALVGAWLLSNSRSLQRVRAR